MATGGRPVALPVAYRVAEGRILFFTGVGSKLGAAFRGEVLGFEVDEVDPATRTGWSVLVVGRSAVVYDRMPAVMAGLQAWAAGTRPYLVAIELDSVTGRRVSTHPL